MSSCTVYVLVMLFVAANALTDNEGPTAACGRYFTRSQAALCEHVGGMEGYADKTVVNVKWLAQDAAVRAQRVAALIKQCCYQSCTMQQILSYC